MTDLDRLEALAQRSGQFVTLKRATVLALVEQARSGQRFTEALKHARWRWEDLSWCGKDDDCETKADGARLVLDDIDVALGAVGADRAVGR